jgi:hypothetical protein
VLQTVEHPGEAAVVADERQLDAHPQSGDLLRLLSAAQAAVDSAKHTTPPAIVAKINADMMRLLKDADVLDRIARESSLPGGSTPEQFRTFLQNEIVKWTRVIKETGATVDQ